MNKLSDNSFLGVKMYFLNSLESLLGKREAVIYFDCCCEVFLNMNKANQILSKGSLLSESEILQFLYAIKSFQKGEPLAYVLENQFFYGLNFKVNSSVLIPRPETEELVDLIVNNYPNALNVIDIGTGSGCIALAIKSKLNNSNVHAVDVSEEALEIAKENAKSNNLNVVFHQYDALKLSSTEPASFINGQWDVIVSNPPYIPEKEQLLMESNVLDYEPHLALFVPDDDPLLFYRKIGEWAIQKLSNKGVLCFEIHEDLGNKMIELLKGIGFTSVKLFQDLQEKDRMVVAERSI